MTEIRMGSGRAQRNILAISCLVALAFALAGGAQAATATLFGRGYTVSELQLTGTTFSGSPSAVQGQPTANTGGISLDFVPGATAAQDRLFCAFNIAGGTTGSHLFRLTGANAQGLFTASSAITYLYGPNVADSVGGRPAAVWLRNDDAAGSTDRNLYTASYTNEDTVRCYDLGNAFTGYIADSLADYRYVNTDGSALGPLAPATCGMEAIAGVTDRTVIVGEGLKVGTFDLTTHTQDNNVVTIAPAGVGTGTGLRDILQLADNSYIVTGNLADGTQPVLIAFSMSYLAGSPPTITPGNLLAHNLATSPIPGMNAGEWLVGAAAGRNGILYLTGTDGANVILYTLTPTPSKAANWQKF